LGNSRVGASSGTGCMSAVVERSWECTWTLLLGIDSDPGNRLSPVGTALRRRLQTLLSSLKQTKKNF